MVPMGSIQWGVKNGWMFDFSTSKEASKQTKDTDVTLRSGKQKT